MKIDNIEFVENKYGMLVQKEYQPFDYNKQYLNQQSTNVEMSYIRLGYLMAFIPFEVLRNSVALELGPGTGVFFEIAQKYVKKMEGFDIAPDSKYSTVTLEEVYNRKWDILMGFDTIEHMHNLADIFDINFTYGYFSSPCPPENGIKDGISQYWHHFKVNEHLTYFTTDQFKHFVEDHGYKLLNYPEKDEKGNLKQTDCPEDLLRKRWGNQKNINSFIIKKV